MNKLFTKIAGLSLGLAMAIGVGVAVVSKEAKVASATESEYYNYTFTAQKFTDNSTAKTLGSLTWTPSTTWTSGTGYWGYDATKGQQWGSGSHKLNTLTLTSGSVSYVSSIDVYASIASSGSCKLSVAVGTTDFKNGSNTEVSLTTTSTKYTFTSTSTVTGAVKITLKGNAKKAQYIKQIVINTDSGGGETDYTLTYNGNGNTGGTVPSAVTSHGSISLSSTVLTKTNYVHDGWGDSSHKDDATAQYSFGASYALTADVTLYAHWTATYTVTYNANGADSGTVPVDSAAHKSGSSVTVLGNTGNLVKDGKQFSGWNTSPDGSGTTYGADATFTISANTTLYAKWETPSQTVSITLDFTKSTYGLTTTQSTSQTFTGDAATYSFSSAGGSGCKVSAESPTDSSYFMMGKANAYLKNGSAPANKYLSSITIYYSGTCSGNVILSVGFGSTAAAASSATGSNLHTLSAATQGGNVEVTNSDEECSYFYIKVTNAYNVQISKLVFAWDMINVPATSVEISVGSESSSTITNHEITLEKGSGTNNVYTDDLVATVSGDDSATPTDTTVTWSKSGTNASYADLANAIIDDENNEIIFDISTAATGTFTITASADGGTNVTDSVTYTIIDSSAAPITGVTVSGTPVTPQYTGNAFNTSGLTFTANHSSDSSQDYVITSGISWENLVAGQHPQGHYTENGVTVDFSVNSVTVLQNTLTITIGGSMTKTTYAQNESWDPSGLTKSGQYADGTSYSGEISWSYSPASPSLLSTGSQTVRVTATAESSESSYVDVSVTINEPSYTPTEGIGAGGRFYIMSYDLTRGMSAEPTTSAAPAAVLLSSENSLIPFDFTLVDDYTYEVSVTIESTKYLVINNSAAASSNNNNIRIMEAPSVTLKSTNWQITKSNDTYILGQNTVDSTIRYLSYNTDSQYDFRGYTSIKTFGEGSTPSKQDSHVYLIEEGHYANEIAEAIMSNETPLCNGGSTAPSVERWNTIAGITHIQHELSILTATEAAPKDEHGDTPTGTTAEKAMARYDEIMVRYNTVSTKTYADFLGRIEAHNLPLSNSKVLLATITKNGGTTIAIIVISAVSLAAIGGYFLFRKKKEN